MRMCDGCNEQLLNANARYIQETPDGGATLRNSRSRKSFGTCFPKDLIRDIIDGAATVCQPCARAAIEMFTGPNAPADSIDEQPTFAPHVACEYCGHSAGLDHQRGECFNRLGG